MRIRHEETGIVTVGVSDFAESCGLEIVYDSNKDIALSSVSISRPGIFLSGYTEYFASSRIQVFGKNEVTYLTTLDAETRQQRLDVLFAQKFPALIICRGQRVSKEITDIAASHEVPVFKSSDITADVINRVTAYLNEVLAHTTSEHGVLLDVFGMGVMLTGDSGLGKSETALELIHRGHRLVSDDLVEIKEIEGKLIGSSPKITHNMLEVRGLGIIDVRAIYGVGAVIDYSPVQLIINLEPWKDNEEYDRIGASIQYKDILGVQVPRYSIPIMPGRNCAVIVEVAVRNYRLQVAGYNALEEINKRIQTD